MKWYKKKNNQPNIANTNQLMPAIVKSLPIPKTVLAIIKNTAPIKKTTKGMYKRFFCLMRFL